MLEGHLEELWEEGASELCLFVSIPCMPVSGIF